MSRVQELSKMFIMAKEQIDAITIQSMNVKNSPTGVNQLWKKSSGDEFSRQPTFVQITERAKCITSLLGASLNSTLSSSNLEWAVTHQWRNQAPVAVNPQIPGKFSHIESKVGGESKRQNVKTQLAETASCTLISGSSKWCGVPWKNVPRSCSGTGHPFNCQIFPTLLTSTKAPGLHSVLRYFYHSWSLKILIWLISSWVEIPKVRSSDNCLFSHNL